MKKLFHPTAQLSSAPLYRSAIWRLPYTQSTFKKRRIYTINVTGMPMESVADRIIKTRALLSGRCTPPLASQPAFPVQTPRGAEAKALRKTLGDRFGDMFDAVQCAKRYQPL